MNHPQACCRALRCAGLRYILPSLILVCASQFALPFAEADTPPVRGGGPSAESIETQRKEIESASDLDDATRAKILDIYRQAQDELQRTAEHAARAAELQQSASDAQLDVRLRTLKSQLEAARSGAGAQDVKALPHDLPSLQQELAARESRVAELKKRQSDLEAEPKRRANRRKEIRDQLFSAPERSAELRAQLDAMPGDDEPSALTQARRTEQQVRLQLIEQETAVLQAELALYDAEDAVDLVRVQRDMAAMEATRAEKEAKELLEFVNKLRREEAEEAVRQAKRERYAANPLLKPIAEHNVELAEAAQQVAPKIEGVEVALQEARHLADEIKANFEATKKRVESVRLSGPIGLMLRKQRALLPNLSEHRRELAARREEVDAAHLAMLEYDEARSALADLDPYIQEIDAQADPTLSDADRDQLQHDAEDLLSRQRDNLDALNRLNSTYFDRLVELDLKEQELLDEAEAFAAFIDERVLWIRSGRPLMPAEVRRDRESVALVLSLDNWQSIGRLLWDDIRKNPIPLFSALLLFGTLFHFRFRFRRELKDIGAQVQRNSFYLFRPTLRALLLTAIIALLGPGMFMYVAWRLSLAATENQFASDVAQAMFAVLAVYFPLEILRQTARNDGLLESHFQWPERAVLLLHDNLRWLIWLALPMMLLVEVLHTNDPDHGRGAVERLVYLGMTIVFGVFLARVMHPARGMVRDVVAYNQGGWVDRLKYIWYSAAVAAPVALGILAALGYYYTARQLDVRLRHTAWLFMGVMLVRELLMRWVFVQRRRLSIEQAKERRAAAQAAAESDASNTASPVPVEVPGQTDLAASSTQIQRLLNAMLLSTLALGLYFVWVDVLPALNVLNRWELWQTVTQVTENVAPKGEAPVIRTVDRVVAITAANCLLSVIIAALTIIAARNVPGLLEMSVLQRLPMDAAVRYAVTTLARYVIVLVGVIFGFSAIGVGWSKVQWLATALTFGLAFGLQEIFANFVSGLIILFEQPIRVGDVVTIDNTSGVVARVRIRATTIVNWDRKEFIVPNKEFITGRLLNWTLSDTVNRLQIKVGLAYGSDTRKAHRLLKQIVSEHPGIMREPSPVVAFEEFGENALTFTIRAYLPTLENRLQVVHELHQKIDDVFRAEQLDIAFPQRDVHLKTLPEQLRRYLDRNDETTNRGPVHATAGHGSNGNGNGNGKHG